MMSPLPTHSPRSTTHIDPSTDTETLRLILDQLTTVLALALLGDKTQLTSVLIKALAEVDSALSNT